MRSSMRTFGDSRKAAEMKSELQVGDTLYDQAYWERRRHRVSGVRLQSRDDRRLCEQMNAQASWVNALRDELQQRGKA